MRAIAFTFSVWVVLGFPSVVVAQTAVAQPTVGSQAISRDVHSRAARELPDLRDERALVPNRVVVEDLVPLRATVVERPVVQERVVVTSTPARWWDIYVRNRYGYYDDAYFDDNWFYDYYEVPGVTRRAATPGFRTGWTYEPTAERGLFNF